MRWISLICKNSSFSTFIYNQSFLKEENLLAAYVYYYFIYFFFILANSGSRRPCCSTCSPFGEWQTVVAGREHVIRDAGKLWVSESMQGLCQCHISSALRNKSRNYSAAKAEVVISEAVVRHSHGRA